MIFPSFLTTTEPGLISTVGFYGVIFFTMVLHFWRRVLVLLILLVALFTFSWHTLAFGAGFNPNACGTACMSQQRNLYQYWGTPYGPWAPVYPYPNTPYHAFYGPVPSYYSWPPSPYRPDYLYDCPYCGPRLIYGAPMPAAMGVYR